MLGCKVSEDHESAQWVIKWSKKLWGGVYIYFAQTHQDLYNPCKPIELIMISFKIAILQ